MKYSEHKKGKGYNIDQKFAGCHILSPLKEPYPQGLRCSFRHERRIWEKMRILLLHLIFTLPGELKTSPRVLAYLDNQNTALLQRFDLTVHDLDVFFDEVKFVVNLDFIQRYSKRFVRHAFLQIQDVKRTMNSTQLLRSSSR
ncbi:hypothetical protein Tco_0868008 [Tanacetum coccineum]